jgi:CRISPR-associated exonuclease Cas4
MDSLRLIAVGTVFFFSVLIAAWPVPVKKKSAGRAFFLPGYRLIYSDTRGKHAGAHVLASKLLRSEKDDISGKPDYIYKHRFLNQYIPVEVKSGAVKDSAQPHTGDLLQLGAYFLIIEEVFGVRPRQGRLLYKDAGFIIRNTGRLRKEVRATLYAMRRMLKDGKGTPNVSYVNCRHCVLRGTLCEHYTEE